MKKFFLILITFSPLLFASCDNEEVDPYQDQEFDFRDPPEEEEDYYPYSNNISEEEKK